MKEKEKNEKHGRRADAAAEVSGNKIIHSAKGGGGHVDTRNMSSSSGGSAAHQVVAAPLLAILYRHLHALIAAAAAAHNRHVLRTLTQRKRQQVQQYTPCPPIHAAIAAKGAPLVANSTTNSDGTVAVPLTNPLATGLTMTMTMAMGDDGGEEDSAFSPARCFMAVEGGGTLSGGEGDGAATDGYEHPLYIGSDRAGTLARACGLGTTPPSPAVSSISSLRVVATLSASLCLTVPDAVDDAEHTRGSNTTRRSSIAVVLALPLGGDLAAAFALLRTGTTGLTTGCGGRGAREIETDTEEEVNASRNSDGSGDSSMAQRLLLHGARCPHLWADIADSLTNPSIAFTTTAAATLSDVFMQVATEGGTTPTAHSHSRSQPHGGGPQRCALVALFASEGAPPPSTERKGVGTGGRGSSNRPCPLSMADLEALLLEQHQGSDAAPDTHTTNHGASTATPPATTAAVGPLSTVVAPAECVDLLRSLWAQQQQQQQQQQQEEQEEHEEQQDMSSSAPLEYSSVQPQFKCTCCPALVASPRLLVPSYSPPPPSSDATAGAGHHGWGGMLPFAVVCVAMTISGRDDDAATTTTSATATASSACVRAAFLSSFPTQLEQQWEEEDEEDEESEKEHIDSPMIRVSSTKSATNKKERSSAYIVGWGKQPNTMLPPRVATMVATSTAAVITTPHTNLQQRSHHHHHSQQPPTATTTTVIEMSAGRSPRQQQQQQQQQHSSPPSSPLVRVHSGKSASDADAHSNDDANSHHRGRGRGGGRGVRGASPAPLDISDLQRSATSINSTSGIHTEALFPLPAGAVLHSTGHHPQHPVAATSNVDAENESGGNNEGEKSDGAVATRSVSSLASLLVDLHRPDGGAPTPAPPPMPASPPTPSGGGGVDSGRDSGHRHGADNDGDEDEDDRHALQLSLRVSAIRQQHHHDLLRRGGGGGRERGESSLNSKTSPLLMSSLSIRPLFGEKKTDKDTNINQNINNSSHLHPHAAGGGSGRGGFVLSSSSPSSPAAGRSRANSSFANHSTGTGGGGDDGKANHRSGRGANSTGGGMPDSTPTTPTSVADGGGWSASPSPTTVSAAGVGVDSGQGGHKQRWVVGGRAAVHYTTSLTAGGGDDDGSSSSITSGGAAAALQGAIGVVQDAAGASHHDHHQQSAPHAPVANGIPPGLHPSSQAYFAKQAQLRRAVMRLEAIASTSTPTGGGGGELHADGGAAMLPPRRQKHSRLGKGATGEEVGGDFRQAFPGATPPPHSRSGGGGGGRRVSIIDPTSGDDGGTGTGTCGEGANSNKSRSGRRWRGAGRGGRDDDEDDVCGCSVM